MSANDKIHTSVKTTSSLLISRHIAPDGTEIVWKGLNIVRGKPGKPKEDPKNSKLNGLEIIWEDIQIIKRGKHINPSAAANVQPISYYAPVLAYNKNTTPGVPAPATNTTGASGAIAAPASGGTGLPSSADLSKMPTSEIASNVDLQLHYLLNPQEIKEEEKEEPKDVKEAVEKKPETEKKDGNNNPVIDSKGVVTKVGTLTAVKPGEAPKLEKMDTSSTSKTEVKVESKDSKDNTKDATSSSKDADQAKPKSEPLLDAADIKDEKVDPDDKPIVGDDGSISSDLATELKAWRVRAQNAEKRVQKVELQFVNMKRRAETAEVRAGIKPADDPEGETKAAVEAMKITVEKNATPEKKVEAAIKWATDAMVNQAAAEKDAKAAEEKAIKAKKDATVAINDSKLSEMRADNAEKKIFEYEEQIEKMKKEVENSKNRAVAAESRAEAMLNAMKKRAGREVESGSDREGPKPPSKFGNQLKDRRKSDEERFEIIEIDSIKKNQKPKGREELEYIKGPGGRNISAKYKCSHCEFTSTRKTDYEKHVKRCVLEIAARSSRMEQRKPNKPNSMEDSSISKNRVRRQAAANALDTIVEGDQSWQGLMLDNKGIRPGVPVPLPGEESQAGFNDDDEETFLAAECQELFGDILDDDAKNSNSNADLQLAEEILNEWEKEDLMPNKSKSKDNKKNESTDNKSKTDALKKRPADDDETSKEGKKEKIDNDEEKPLKKKVTKEDDFGPAIPLF